MENSDDMMKAATELIDSKNRGGLVYPTSFTLQLTMLMERGFRLLMDSNVHAKGGEVYLTCVVKNVMGTPPDDFQMHALDTQHYIDNHYTNLINLLVHLFYKVRINHHSKRLNLSLHKSMIRKKSTKLVIFTGQLVNVGRKMRYDAILLCFYFNHCKRSFQ